MAETDVTTPRVLVFFDYACPFCYIDHFRVKQLRSTYDLEMTLVPFELRPTMPEEGVSVREAGLEHPPHVEAHLLREAREGGFPYQPPERVPKSHDALVLGELGRDAGEDEHWQVHEAIFRAYFGQGRDIGSRAVLLDIAEEQALDRDELVRAWDDAEYDARLEAFARIALGLGVTATPAILVCDELFIGSRPFKVLEAAVQRCRGGHEGPTPGGEQAEIPGDSVSRAAR